MSTIQSTEILCPSLEYEVLLSVCVFSMLSGTSAVLDSSAETFFSINLSKSARASSSYRITVPE